MEEPTPSPVFATDPVKILSAEFTARSQRNPRYSLRAFAKSLGISHTILSLVLSGKRSLSKKAALQIAQRLELSPPQAEILIGRDKKTSAPSAPRGSDYVLMDLDTFNLISDWVHYAILSLIDTQGFRDDPKWIAQRLGINPTHAKVCWQRLLDLELLEKTDGHWKQSGKSIKIENGKSTESTRKFHRQLLEKALFSLENDPMEVRDFSSMTLAIDPKEIPYAKERIRQFRRELTAELEAKGAPKEVYQLAVQIYPVTRSPISRKGVKS